MGQQLILVSADGHTGAPPQAYHDYIEPEFLGDLDRLSAENDEWLSVVITAGGSSEETLKVIDGREAIRTGGELGAFDLERRVRELDAEGIAGELLLSGHQMCTLPFFGVVNNPYPPRLRAAGTRAYHRWLADAMTTAPGRFYGVAEAGPCLDMAATVAELEWVAEHGFVGVLLPGMVADPALPPLHSPYYDPFWAACARLGLVVTVHAGWGGVQGQFQAFLRQVHQAMGGSGEIDLNLQQRLRERLDAGADSPLRLDLGPRRAMWQLMLGGVFDRFPELRLALTEVRADWLPATLRRLDERAARPGGALKRTPSEYFRLHCVVIPSSPHRAEIEMRHEIGVGRLLFGVDFPHPEGTWPNTRDWIRAAFAGVPEGEARAILGENAIDVYGLDRAALARAAARVGPRPAEVLGEHEVDPRLLAHFHKRSGYARPVEDVDLAAVDHAWDDDLVALTPGG
ncbi:amidohydrolase family protein [Frankia gtarii]|uniref:amidohydrolase family protein n=1 Tax=Frankia gtarii TaxID=2950102 RepID=UPI0021BE6344|nr:amidohydrolase family protein [Frankia gtarii]